MKDRLFHLNKLFFGLKTLIMTVNKYGNDLESTSDRVHSVA